MNRFEIRTDEAKFTVEPQESLTNVGLFYLLNFVNYPDEILDKQRYINDYDLEDHIIVEEYANFEEGQFSLEKDIVGTFEDVFYAHFGRDQKIKKVYLSDKVFIFKCTKTNNYFRVIDTGLVKQGFEKVYRVSRCFTFLETGKYRVSEKGVKGIKDFLIRNGLDSSGYSLRKNSGLYCPYRGAYLNAYISFCGSNTSDPFGYNELIIEEQR